MKGSPIMVAFALLAGSFALPFDVRNNCNPNGNPDCLPGYNMGTASALFDNISAATTGTPMTTYGPLKLTGWRAAAAPAGQPHALAPPHLTPESGNQYIRAKESSGAFNSTSISTISTVFKFKSLFFGCSRYVDFTPIPCTMTIQGFNPGRNGDTKTTSISIDYVNGNPGPTGEAPLQEVAVADLAGLGVANYFVFSTTGQSGTKPRLVLDNVDVVTYDFAS